MAGRHLSHEVADDEVGNTNVRSDDLDQGFADAALIEQTNEGNPQPFGIDLGGVGRHSAGSQTADVDMVSDRQRKADELLGKKYRPDHDDVGKVKADAVGIIGDVDI